MSDPMSNNEQMFLCWAPDNGRWTPWAKPVLFNSRILTETVDSLPDIFNPFNGLDLGINFGQTVVVVDLPGSESVEVGVALSEQGFRPVPLYNGCEGPSPVVSVEGLVRAVATATASLREKPPAPDAPPVFLLDSKRMSGYPTAGNFDNRWMVFPQDFPSGNLLASLGYQHAVVISSPDGSVQEDLAHVLLRWREAGMQIKSYSLSLNSLHDIVIPKPSKYRLFFYRALAKMGLRPNSAGGFGDIIPVPSETSYGGYG